MIQRLLVFDPDCIMVTWLIQSDEMSCTSFLQVDLSIGHLGQRKSPYTERKLCPSPPYYHQIRASTRNRIVFGPFPAPPNRVGHCRPR